jgi:hypothetical protein
MRSDLTHGAFFKSKPMAELVVNALERLGTVGFEILALCDG